MVQVLFWICTVVDALMKATQDPLWSLPRVLTDER